ncbi:MAG: hypothetical protein U9N73_10735 [Candidatus Auribacterota bacterium]|nr:hypothetical protein [Candidatus Auribacterota bacterium]
MRSAPRTLIYLLLIICVGIVIYIPAFSASFHLDDGPSIRDNVVIRKINPEAYQDGELMKEAEIEKAMKYAGWSLPMATAPRPGIS